MKSIYLFGISKWKQDRIKHFFPEENLIFLDKDSSSFDKKSVSKIVIWGKKGFPEAIKRAKELNIPILFAEDGFIRSISLGLDFAQSYSLVLDSKGIYFDTSTPNDLEDILNTHKFSKKLLKRAKRVKEFLVKNRLSKYNLYRDREFEIDTSEYKKSILVVGQVEDDASIIYGADGMKNLELLKLVKFSNPNSYIIYKPHPDTISGKRKGKIPKKIALKYANRVEKRVSIDSLLDIVDEVHTITSLVGLEALIRGKKVITYGTPFYAGWGLTEDKRPIKRKRRNLTLLELIAGAYILYPKYISPKTLKPCEVEEVLRELKAQKELYHSSLKYRLEVNIKNFLYKKYFAVERNLNEISNFFKAVKRRVQKLFES
jgi:capsular polysaccharide export protein